MDLEKIDKKLREIDEDSQKVLERAKSLAANKDLIERYDVLMSQEEDLSSKDQRELAEIEKKLKELGFSPQYDYSEDK